MKQRRSLRVGKKQQPGPGPGPGPGPAPQEIPLEELKAILERAKTTALSAEDLGKLEAAIDTLAFLTSELEAKGTTIKRLRQLIFGARTEKTSNLFGPAAGEEPDSTGAEDDAAAATTPDAASNAAPESAAAEGAAAGEEPRKKRKGHGRNGAASYTGAEKIAVPHEELRHGDPCPFCQKGKVYEQAEPATLVRVTGMAPLSVKVFEKQRLRCNLCGEVVTAKSPEGVGEEKYDESATSMVAVLRYGTGLPFHRLERLQGNLGLPLPAATQWGLVAEAAELLAPAYGELTRLAAQGELLHNDDTNAKILELLAQQQPEAAPEEEPDPEADQSADERTGIFTTGIVSQVGEHKIALFFTGRQHAGENLADVLAQRAAELAPPIQMCDALSRNIKGEFHTILANCLVHSRRKFVDVVDSFPDEVRFIVETLRDVYRNDDDAKQQAMTPEQRLRFHQEHSGPLMHRIAEWLDQQLAEQKVEPNSGL
ncbi:MAG: transposase, partial [Deltaproteobacteria bacterium]|nr:transposase [Deltaproteobacteria bacterium]